MLTLKNISHFFGDRLILKGISLAFSAGSITLVGGRNGAGKSTLLNITAGLLEPSEGEALRERDDLVFSMIGHQTFLYPELTAMENLRFWGGMYSKVKSLSAIQSALERVELGPFAEEKASSFSRGMAQRLSIARALLPTPDVLLLDEPATGLDTRSTGILLREIGLAKERGAAVIWVSHSLAHDAAHADYVTYIDKKSLAYYGPAHGFDPEAFL